MVFYAQLEKLDEVISLRLKIWNKYHREFESLEKKGKLIRPKVPAYNTNNAHMYFLILKNKAIRDNFIKRMKQYNIQCTTHYVPLHKTSYGSRFNKKDSELPNGEQIANTIVRLPLWPGLEPYQNYILEKAKNIINSF